MENQKEIQTLLEKMEANSRKQVFLSTRRWKTSQVTCGSVPMARVIRFLPLVRAASRSVI